MQCNYFKIYFLSFFALLFLLPNFSFALEPSEADLQLMVNNIPYPDKTAVMYYGCGAFYASGYGCNQNNYFLINTDSEPYHYGSGDECNSYDDGFWMNNNFGWQVCGVGQQVYDPYPDSYNDLYRWDSVNEEWDVYNMTAYYYGASILYDSSPFVWSNKNIYFSGDNDPQVKDYYPPVESGQVIIVGDPITSETSYSDEAYRISFTNRSDFSSTTWMNTGYSVLVKSSAELEMNFMHFFPQGSQDTIGLVYSACPIDYVSVTECVVWTETYLDEIDNYVINEFDENTSLYIYDGAVSLSKYFDAPQQGEDFVLRVSTFAILNRGECIKTSLWDGSCIQWENNEYVEMNFLDVAIVLDDVAGDDGNRLDFDQRIGELQDELDDKYNLEAIITRVLKTLFVPDDEFFSSKYTDLRDSFLSAAGTQNEYGAFVDSFATAEQEDLDVSVTLFGDQVSFYSIDSSTLSQSTLDVVHNLISMVVWFGMLLWMTYSLTRLFTRENT